MDPAAVVVMGLGVFALFVGLCGSMLPVLPGPPISALGSLILQVGLTMESPASGIGWGLCIVSMLLGGVMTVADLLAPSLVSWLGGSSKRAGRYATVGVIIALILSCTGGGPFAAATGGLGAIPALLFAVAMIFVGAFVGGVLGELEEPSTGGSGSDRTERALKSGAAQAVGIGVSMVAKVGYCVVALCIAVLQAVVQFV
jgi:hypothetical protein